MSKKQKSSAVQETKADINAFFSHVEDEILTPSKFSLEDLLKQLGADGNIFERALKDGKQITSGLALRLSKISGHSPEYWIDLGFSTEVEKSKNLMATTVKNLDIIQSSAIEGFEARKQENILKAQKNAEIAISKVKQRHADKISALTEKTTQAIQALNQRKSDLQNELARLLPFQDKKYYFLHIKKCAGTTFIGLSKTQPHVNFYHPNANGNPIYDDDELKGTARFIPFWDLPLKERREFLLRDSHNFIANEGHLGLEFKKFEEMTYFTILRDPVKRTLSQFHHAKHLGAITANLNTFVSEKSRKVKWMNNFMIFQVTGQWSTGYEKDITDEAIKRLESFDHILFQEFFSEDVQGFEQYGWNVSELQNRNVRKGVKDKDTPTKHTIKLLEDFNQGDYVLYNHFLNKRQNLPEV